MKPRLMWAATLLACFPVTAQDDSRADLEARAFLPADHTLAAYIDMAAVVDSDLWDVIERSPAKLLLSKFRSTFGFDLADVERVDAAATFHDDADDDGKREAVVIVLSGGERVGIEAIDLRVGRGYHRETAGGHPVLVGDEPAMTSPRPGVLVLGDSHHVLGVLERRVRGGAPTPALNQLTTGAKPLAYLAVSGHVRRVFSGLSRELVEGDDPVRYVAARLVQGDDGGMTAAVRIGFENGDHGPARLTSEIEALRTPQRRKNEEGGGMRALLPFLEKLEVRREGREVVLGVAFPEAPVQLITLVATALLPNVVSGQRATGDRRDH